MFKQSYWGQRSCDVRRCGGGVGGLQNTVARSLEPRTMPLRL